MRTEARADRGFTLIEVLVAVAIAAIALAALYQGTLGGLGAARASGQVQDATSRARSRLAALHGAPITPGDQQGDDGGFYRWRTRIVPLATAPVARGDAATVAAGPFAALYAATVWITWNDGAAREVRLDTQLVDTAPRPGAPRPGTPR